MCGSLCGICVLCMVSVVCIPELCNHPQSKVVWCTGRMFVGSLSQRIGVVPDSCVGRRAGKIDISFLDLTHARWNAEL